MFPFKLRYNKTPLSYLIKIYVMYVRLDPCVDRAFGLWVLCTTETRYARQRFGRNKYAYTFNREIYFARICLGRIAV